MGRGGEGCLEGSGGRRYLGGRREGELVVRYLFIALVVLGIGNIMVVGGSRSDICNFGFGV